MSDGIGEKYDQLGLNYLEKLEAAGSPPDLEPFADALPKGGSVLDAGCAGGRDAKYFAKRGFAVTGVDLAETFVEEARKNVPGGVFLKADVMNLPFPPESFDAVWANAVLVHLSKDELLPAFESFARVAKKGARLFLRMKAENPEMTEEQEKNASEGRAGDFTYFNEPEVREALAASGFAITSLESVDSSRPGLKWLKVWAVKE